MGQRRRVGRAQRRRRATFLSRPYAIAAAVGSLMMRSTLRPEMAPASFVAWRCESLKYAGTVTLEAAGRRRGGRMESQRALAGRARERNNVAAPTHTAFLTSVPRYDSAMAFIFWSTIAEISSDANCFVSPL